MARLDLETMSTKQTARRHAAVASGQPARTIANYRRRNQVRQNYPRQNYLRADKPITTP